MMSGDEQAEPQVQSQTANVWNVPVPLPHLCLKWRSEIQLEEISQMWDSYEIFIDLKKLGEPIRVATFIQVIRINALDSHNSLPYTNENHKGKLDKILKYWEAYCMGKTNVTLI